MRGLGIDHGLQDLVASTAAVRAAQHLRARGDLFGRQLACAVRDLDMGVARLVIASTAQLPARFHLLIEATGFERDCAIVERSGVTVEVIFV